MLDEAGVPGLYRAQNGGKVRMTTSAEPHDALGVDCYAWSSSPLRRYVDMVNQWQIIAVLRSEPPAFAPRSPELTAAMRDFDLTYAAYAEYQRGMERYWCLRWLRQHGLSAIDATVRRENLVKLDHLPLVQRVPSLPELPPGQRVRLALGGMDELTLELDCRYVETLGAAEAVADDEVTDD
jgi:Exoribonuclease R